MKNSIHLLVRVILIVDSRRCYPLSGATVYVSQIGGVLDPRGVNQGASGQIKVHEPLSPLRQAEAATMNFPISTI